MTSPVVSRRTCGPVAAGTIGGVTLGKALGTGTIKDAEAAPNEFHVGAQVIPEMDLCGLAACKTTAKIMVSLNAKPLTNVSIHYQTVNAGAIAGTNYTSKNATLTFLAGGTNKKYISVILLGNTGVNSPPYGIDINITNPSPGMTVSGNGHIEIIDNGAGLPKHNRSKLLEPYVTTKGSKGTGLGLAIVQKSVEQHNGVLSLEDAPLAPGRTHGALLRISLPVLASPEESARHPEAAAASSA